MKKKVFKVMVLGDAGVGKTSILEQYVNQVFTGAYKVTIGSDFLSKELLLGTDHVRLQIWDTAGQEKYRSLSLAYYRGADACMFVFDVTDKRSFNNLEMWMQTFFSQIPEKQVETFPVVIVGNKADKTGDRLVSEDAIKRWCKNHNNVSYFDVSAKTRSGIDEAFERLSGLANQVKTDYE